MLARARSALTYANVMATVAVFLALGGGAYAALKLPANSVGSKQLKKRAVTPAKVSPRTIALFKGQKGAQGAKGDAGAQGPQGIQGIQGDQGPIGPSNAYFNIAYGSSSGTLSATVSVPAGDYAIHGQGAIDSSTPPGQGGCFLFANGNALSGTAADDGYTVHPTSSSGGLETSDEGVAHLAVAGTIADECTTSVAGSFVARVSVMAIRVGTASP